MWSKKGLLCSFWPWERLLIINMGRLSVLSQKMNRRELVCSPEKGWCINMGRLPPLSQKRMWGFYHLLRMRQSSIHMVGIQFNLSHLPFDTVHVWWFGNDFGILRAWCYVLCWTCALPLPTYPVMWGNCDCGNLLLWSQPTCSSTQHRPDWFITHAVHTWSLQTQAVLHRVNEARDLLIFPFIASKFTLITYSFQLHCPRLACLVRN